MRGDFRIREEVRGSRTSELVALLANGDLLCEWILDGEDVTHVPTKEFRRLTTYAVHMIQVELDERIPVGFRPEVKP